MAESSKVPSAGVVVLGARGMVGRAFEVLLSARGIAHRALARPEFDLADPAAPARVIDADTKLVLNCAAWTQVDAAETEEAAATDANGAAVGRLAARCAEVGATLVHYSTDYVFDGHAEAPYAIDHPIAPINAYGRGKAEGERQLRASEASHLLIRTSWVYAPWGQNFVLTMRRLTRERDELRVVADQRGRPTSAEHLAKTTLALLDVGAEGTFHVTDGGACSWHELASFIAETTGSGCTVHPCTTEEFPRPAPRPPYSVLDLGPTESKVGPMPTWRDNVADVLARAGDEASAPRS